MKSHKKFIKRTGIAEKHDVTFYTSYSLGTSIQLTLKNIDGARFSVWLESDEALQMSKELLNHGTKAAAFKEMNK